MYTLLNEYLRREAFGPSRSGGPIRSHARHFVDPSAFNNLLLLRQHFLSLGFNQNNLNLIRNFLIVDKAFLKILVAIDGSKYSFKAAKYAVEISLKYGSELTLLSVVPSSIRYVDSSGFLGMIPPTYFKKYENEAAKWFNRITDNIKKDQLQVKKIKTDVITTPISVVSAILEYAYKKDMDLK